MELTVANALESSGSTRFRVSSAGTAALEDHVMADPMLAALTKRGIDGSAFRARQLTGSMVHRAGIIVTAARDHRRWVTRLDPTAASRTFTLFQLSRLLDATKNPQPAAEGLEEFVRLLNAARGAGGAGSAADDIEDPWKKSPRVYRRVTRRIDDAIVPLTRALTG